MNDKLFSVKSIHILWTKKWEGWRKIVSINQNRKQQNRKSCFSRNIDQEESWQTQHWKNNYQFLIKNQVQSFSIFSLYNQSIASNCLKQGSLVSLKIVVSEHEISTTWQLSAEYRSKNDPNSTVLIRWPGRKICCLVYSVYYLKVTSSTVSWN